MSGHEYGHVGCCGDSPNRHATKHFHATRHPIIEGYDPPEGWGWCYVHEVMLDLRNRITPHNGRIPRGDSFPHGPRLRSGKTSLLTLVRNS